MDIKNIIRMREQFKTFSETIRLTDSQLEDAKKKCANVCKVVHGNYYSCEYDGSSKFLFGSYKTKTNVRPLDSSQDVDVLFKMPIETFEKFDGYESNGQAALLSEIRACLKDGYKTAEVPRAWGKVVLVVTSDGHHNIELLPALEKADGTFLIPNSENGGSWESFDPRAQLDKFHNSNKQTDGLTGDLTRMAKKWIRNHAGLSYKSHELLEKIINFLIFNYSQGAKFENYPSVIKNLFSYLAINCDESQLSYIRTALNRAEKALAYIEEEKYREASEEYRKIFGPDFPLANNPVKNNTRVFATPSRPYANN